MFDLFLHLSKNIENVSLVFFLSFLIDMTLILSLGALTYFLLKKIKLEIIGYLLIGLVIGKSGLNLLSYPLVGISQEEIKNFDPSYYSLININYSKYIILFALATILIKAGFGISKDILSKTAKDSILLSFVPNICEGVCVALLSHIWLELHLVEAFMLGFIISAVSPSIVVPSMLRIKKQKYGEQKNVTSIVLSGASLDDVVSIIIFGATMNIWIQLNDLNPANSGGYSFLKMLPIWFISIYETMRFILGAFLGFLIGIVFAKYVLKKIYNKIIITIFLTFILAIAFSLKNWENYLLIAGSIAILALGFAIRNYNKTFYKLTTIQLNWIWKICKIFLFILITAKMNFKTTQNDQIGVMVLILLIGLIARSIGVFLALARGPLSFKEKLFCAFANIPKATVQASLGSTPLSLVILGSNLDLINSSNTILTFSVMSILITAPLGVLLVERSYKILLKKVP